MLSTFFSKHQCSKSPQIPVNQNIKTMPSYKGNRLIFDPHTLIDLISIPRKNILHRETLEFSSIPQN